MMTTPTKCQCRALGDLLARAGCIMGPPGIRCGVCCDAIIAAKNDLVRENNDLLIQLATLREARLP